MYGGNRSDITYTDTVTILCRLATGRGAIFLKPRYRPNLGTVPDLDPEELQ